VSVSSSIFALVDDRDRAHGIRPDPDRRQHPCVDPGRAAAPIVVAGFPASRAASPPIARGIARSLTDAAMGCATAPCVKAIMGNATMIKAYSDGIPANGKSVPDGAVIAKIEWAKSSNAASPYAVNVPGVLNDISFIVKDAKRFPDTDGWGYA
jgi:hypothetical protein